MCHMLLQRRLQAVRRMQKRMCSSSGSFKAAGGLAVARWLRVQRKQSARMQSSLLKGPLSLNRVVHRAMLTVAVLYDRASCLSGMGKLGAHWGVAWAVASGWRLTRDSPGGHLTAVDGRWSMVDGRGEVPFPGRGKSSTPAVSVHSIGVCQLPTA